jgi:hypothetical protein
MYTSLITVHLALLFNYYFVSVTSLHWKSQVYIYIYNIYIYRAYTKEWCGFKVNKRFIFHITPAQHTPSAAATVQVSRALPAVRFSCLLSKKFVIG